MDPTWSAPTALQLQAIAAVRDALDALGASRSNSREWGAVYEVVRAAAAECNCCAYYFTRMSRLSVHSTLHNICKNHPDRARVIIAQMGLITGR